MSQLPRDGLKTLYVACDHAGLEMKEHLQKSITELPWNDLGTYSKDSVDYPDFAVKLCPLIDGSASLGVLICGSGQGMAIRANRFPHIRAALCWNNEVARLARAHNNANVLCLGGRLIDFKMAEEVLITFLSTAFEGGRHQSRVEKLWPSVGQDE